MARFDKLKVYQKGLDFAAIRSGLLNGLSRRVAACDHLDRASESIVVNIAHASSSWSPNDRIVSLGNANGSALECAACLDILVAKGLLADQDVYPGKSVLAEIVSILIAMWKTTANRVREDHAPYRTEKGRLFSHAKFLGIAYKSTVQSAALIDLATAHASAPPARLEEGHELVGRIATMLTSLSKVTTHVT